MYTNRNDYSFLTFQFASFFPFLIGDYLNFKAFARDWRYRQNSQDTKNGLMVHVRVCLSSLTPFLQNTIFPRCSGGVDRTNVGAGWFGTGDCGYVWFWQCVPHASLFCCCSKNCVSFYDVRVCRRRGFLYVGVKWMGNDL
jgi:hypothetical protein